MIDLYQTSPLQNPIDLYSKRPRPLPPSVVKDKAEKADFTLGDKSPGYDNLFSAFSSGNEGFVQNYIAQERDLRLRNVKQSILEDYMANKKGPVTKQEKDLIFGLTQQQLTDPSFALEEEFSRKVLDTSQTLDENKILQDAMTKDQSGTLQSFDVTQFNMTRQQITISRLEKLKAEAEKRSLGGKAWDLFEQVIPVKWWWETQNQVDTKGKASDILPGDNWEQQAAYLNNLLPADFYREFNAAIDRIAYHNIDSAINFAYYVLAHSSSDTYWNNLLGIADVADVAGTIGGAVLKGGKALAKGSKVLSDLPEVSLRKSLKDVAKAAGEEKISLPNAVAATGDTVNSAAITAVKSLRSKIIQADTDFRGTSLWESVPSILNPRSITKRASDLSKSSISRIEEHLIESSDFLQKAVLNTSLASRLSPLAEGKAISRAIESIKSDFSHVNDAILDVRHSTPEKPNLGNINTVEISLGKPDGSLFAKKKQLNAYAERYGLPLGSYTAKQQGNRFYISVLKDVSETDSETLALQLDTKNTAPQSLISTFIGSIRTPEDILSRTSRENRHVVTHASQEFRRHIVEVAKGIGKLPKRDLARLEDFLNANRDFKTIKKDAEGKPFWKIGRYYDNLADLEKAWMDHTGQAISEKTAEAYFKFRQLNDLDYIVRNLSVYRDLARQGVNQHTLRIGGKQTEGILGKTLESLPASEEKPEHQPIFAILQDDGGVTIQRRSEMTQDQMSALNRQIKDEGRKVIQIADPEKALKNYGIPEPINFVVTKDSIERPLDYKLIPYNEGGHSGYPQDWFGKQAKVLTFSEKSDQVTRLRHNYVGDKAIAPFTTEAEAKKYISRINKARELLKKPQALKDYLAKELPIFERKDFVRMFKESKDETGNTIPARFNPKEPFVVAFRNQTVEDALRNTENDLSKRYINLTSTASSPYNLMKNVSKEFTGPRDLDLSAIKETPSGLRLTTAKKIDSFQMMSKAVSSLTNDRFFKDYQIQAVSSWVRQFGNALDVPQKELFRDPLKYLLNPVYDKSTGKAVLVRHAENNRKAVVAFLNKQSTLDQRLHMTMHKLLNSVYDNLGQGASDFASGFNVIRLDDPFKYTRAFAFHLKLGLFNWVQLFTQSQTLFHSMAITGNPVRSLSSLAGSFLMKAASYNSKHLGYLAKKATKFGWTEAEFKDAYEQLRLSGFDLIEGEVGYLDDVTNPSLFKSGPNKFLDKGKMFFSFAERNNRQVAWNIAYKEFRQKFPSKVITERDRAGILTRADDLSLNMTRASNTSLQRGVFSLPLQFFTYQQRMLEQMLGKRLTRAEKARVFLTYSGLYGVPVAASGAGGAIGAGAAAALEGIVSGQPVEALKSAGKGALGGLYPFYDDIRQTALEKGVNVDSGWLEAVMEGIPAVAWEAMFGNEYSPGERYGPTGLDVLKEIYTGQKTLAEIAGGASGSILGDVYETSWPVLMWMTNSLREDDQQYPLKLNDFLVTLQNVSSVDNLTKMVYMMNTGRYLTKNNLAVTDTDTQDALMRGFFGLSPRDVNDTFLKLGSESELRDVKNKAKRRIVQNLKMALEAKSKEERDQFMQRAKAESIAAGMNPTEYSGIIADTLDDRTLSDKINMDFYTRQIPQQDFEQRSNKFLQDIRKGQ